MIDQEKSIRLCDNSMRHDQRHSWENIPLVWQSSFAEIEDIAYELAVYVIEWA